MRRWWLLVLLVTAAAAVPRAWPVAERALWFDEGSTEPEAPLNAGTCQKKANEDPDT